MESHAHACTHLFQFCVICHHEFNRLHTIVCLAACGHKHIDGTNAESCDQSRSIAWTDRADRFIITLLRIGYNAPQPHAVANTVQHKYLASEQVGWINSQARSCKWFQLQLWLLVSEEGLAHRRWWWSSRRHGPESGNRDSEHWQPWKENTTAILTWQHWPLNDRRKVMAHDNPPPPQSLTSQTNQLHFLA